jgi:hypothetical protein
VSNTRGGVFTGRRNYPGAGVRCLIRSGIRGEVFGEQHEGWGVYWET